MSRLCTALVLLAILPASAAARPGPFKYPEGKHGKGELKYINDVPVLTVEGSPEEIGTQIGTLAGKPAAGAVETLRAYIKEIGLEKAVPFLTRAGKQLFKTFPAAYRQEAEALARASGIDLDIIILANTITDLQSVAGCSVLAVSGERSATGAALFGRNWDFADVGNIHEYGLVIVYRPTGQRAFAVVTFPGLLMCGSAINDAGLVLGTNDVREAGDDSPAFNPRGVPMVVGLRKLMETCRSVEEGEKHLRKIKPTRMCSLILGDRKTSAVFEMTTKSLQVRRPVRGLSLCTNHFCSKELAVSLECRRMKALEKINDLAKVSLADVAKKLHEVNQGTYTMQTMVFEPATLKLHLSMGKGPSSARPLKLVELAPLLAKKRGG